MVLVCPNCGTVRSNGILTRKMCNNCNAVVDWKHVKDESSGLDKLEKEPQKKCLPWLNKNCIMLAILILFCLFRLFAVFFIDLPMAVGCKYEPCKNNETFHNMSGFCSGWCKPRSALDEYLQVDTITSKFDARMQALMILYTFFMVPLLIFLTTMVWRGNTSAWVNKLGLMQNCTMFISILLLYIEWAMTSPNVGLVYLYNCVDLVVPGVLIYFYWTRD